MLGVKFLDPLAGIVVSGMILKAGLETGYQRYVFNSPSFSSFFLFLIPFGAYVKIFQFHLVF